MTNNSFIIVSSLTSRMLVSKSIFLFSLLLLLNVLFTSSSSVTAVQKYTVLQSDSAVSLPTTSTPATDDWQINGTLVSAYPLNIVSSTPSFRNIDINPTICPGSAISITGSYAANSISIRPQCDLTAFQAACSPSSLASNAPVTINIQSVQINASLDAASASRPALEILFTESSVTEQNAPQACKNLRFKISITFSSIVGAENRALSIVLGLNSSLVDSGNTIDTNYIARMPSSGMTDVSTLHISGGDSAVVDSFSPLLQPLRISSSTLNYAAPTSSSFSITNNKIWDFSSVRSYTTPIDELITPVFISVDFVGSTAFTKGTTSSSTSFLFNKNRVVKSEFGTQQGFSPGVSNTQSFAGFVNISVACSGGKNESLSNPNNNNNQYVAEHALAFVDSPIGPKVQVNGNTIEALDDAQIFVNTQWFDINPAGGIGYVLRYFAIQLLIDSPSSRFSSVEVSDNKFPSLLNFSAPSALGFPLSGSPINDDHVSSLTFCNDFSPFYNQIHTTAISIFINAVVTKSLTVSNNNISSMQGVANSNTGIEIMNLNQISAVVASSNVVSLTMTTRDEEQCENFITNIGFVKMFISSCVLFMGGQVGSIAVFNTTGKINVSTWASSTLVSVAAVQVNEKLTIVKNTFDLWRSGRGRQTYAVYLQGVNSITSTSDIGGVAFYVPPPLWIKSAVVQKILDTATLFATSSSDFLPPLLSRNNNNKSRSIEINETIFKVTYGVLSICETRAIKLVNCSAPGRILIDCIKYDHAQNAMPLYELTAVSLECEISTKSLQLNNIIFGSSNNSNNGFLPADATAVPGKSVGPLPFFSEFYFLQTYRLMNSAELGGGIAELISNNCSAAVTSFALEESAYPQPVDSPFRWMGPAIQQGDVMGFWLEGSLMLDKTISSATTATTTREENLALAARIEFNNVSLVCISTHLVVLVAQYTSATSEYVMRGCYLKSDRYSFHASFDITRLVSVHGGWPANSEFSTSALRSNFTFSGNTMIMEDTSSYAFASFRPCGIHPSTGLPAAPSSDDIRTAMFNPPTLRFNDVVLDNNSFYIFKTGNVLFKGPPFEVLFPDSTFGSPSYDPYLTINLNYQSPLHLLAAAIQNVVVNQVICFRCSFVAIQAASTTSIKKVFFNNEIRSREIYSSSSISKYMNNAGTPSSCSWINQLELIATVPVATVTSKFKGELQTPFATEIGHCGATPSVSLSRPVTQMTSTSFEKSISPTIRDTHTISVYIPPPSVIYALAKSVASTGTAVLGGLSLVSGAGGNVGRTVAVVQLVDDIANNNCGGPDTDEIPETAESPISIFIGSGGYQAGLVVGNLTVTIACFFVFVAAYYGYWLLQIKLLPPTKLKEQNKLLAELWKEAAFDDEDDDLLFLSRRRGGGVSDEELADRRSRREKRRRDEDAKIQKKIKALTAVPSFLTAATRARATSVIEFCYSLFTYPTLVAVTVLTARAATDFSLKIVLPLLCIVYLAIAAVAYYRIIIRRARVEHYRIIQGAEAGNVYEDLVDPNLLMEGGRDDSRSSSFYVDEDYARSHDGNEEGDDEDDESSSSKRSGSTALSDGSSSASRGRNNNKCSASSCLKRVGTSLDRFLDYVAGPQGEYFIPPAARVQYQITKLDRQLFALAEPMIEGYTIRAQWWSIAETASQALLAIPTLLGEVIGDHRKSCLAAGIGTCVVLLAYLIAVLYLRPFQERFLRVTVPPTVALQILSVMLALFYNAGDFGVVGAIILAMMSLQVVATVFGLAGWLSSILWPFLKRFIRKVIREHSRKNAKEAALMRRRGGGSEGSNSVARNNENDRQDEEEMIPRNRSFSKRNVADFNYDYNNNNKNNNDRRRRRSESWGNNNNNKGGRNYYNDDDEDLQNNNNNSFSSSSAKYFSPSANRDRIRNSRTNTNDNNNGKDDKKSKKKSKHSLMHLLIDDDDDEKDTTSMKRQNSKNRLFSPLSSSPPSSPLQRRNSNSNNFNNKNYRSNSSSSSPRRNQSIDDEEIEEYLNSSRNSYRDRRDSEYERRRNNNNNNNINNNRNSLNRSSSSNNRNSDYNYSQQPQKRISRESSFNNSISRGSRRDGRGGESNNKIDTRNLVTTAIPPPQERFMRVKSPQVLTSPKQNTNSFRRSGRGRDDNDDDDAADNNNFRKSISSSKLSARMKDSNSTSNSFQLDASFSMDSLKLSGSFNDSMRSINANNKNKQQKDKKKPSVVIG